MFTKKGFIKQITIGLIIVAVLSIIPYTTTYALMGRDKCPKELYKGKMVWKGGYYGYFSDKCAKSSGNSDVIKGGIDSSVDTAKELIKKLHDWYNGGGQNKTGAAFIVKTMLGKDADGDGRSIKQSEWDEVEDRITALDAIGGIKWKNQTVERCTTNSYYQSSKNDDAFYKRMSDFYSCGKDPAIKFDGGYVLDRDCANPIGNIDPLPKAKKWFIKSSTSVNRASAAPGQILNWDHKIWNDGPDSTTESIHSNVVMSGFSNGWNGTHADADKGSGVGDGNNVRTDFSGYDDDYAVTQNDVGNNLCEKVQYDPVDWLGTRNGSSGNKCVSVPYNYSLAPAIGVVSDVVDPDSTTAIPGVVTNSGPTKSKGSEWRITQVILRPGKPKPNEFGGNNSADPCPNFFTPGFGNGTCAVIASGVNKVFNANGANPDGSVKAALIDNSISASGIIGDLEVGQKVCYALSVRDRSSSSSQWAHSRLVCQTVGKKPKVQIWAGDLSTQGSAQTINTVKTIAGKPITFGSWSEYGIFAGSSVTGMGSGSAFAAAGMANATVVKSSTLSFSNTNNAGCTTSFVGCYKMTRTIPDVAASFPGNGVVIGVGVVLPNDLLVSPGTYIGTHNGNLTINQSDLDPGKSIILKVTGTVTIAGNQTYNPDNKGAKYTNGAQLPQLVIIANRIVINDTVTNVDAWLVATGVNGIVETCNTGSLSYILNAAPVDLRLTSNKCNQLLTVNGPVMAKQLWLRRTAGSGTGAASGDPAEVFNLRADTYLWAMARAISNGHIQTVHTTELPPRF